MEVHLLVRSTQYKCRASAQWSGAASILQSIQLKASATGAMGVFYGCIRGKSVLKGNTLVHRGMVYVIEGDIFLLSQIALKDLGVIQAVLPRIGEFGGIEQQGDGQDRFEVDRPYNIRYIEVEHVLRITMVDEEIITGDMVVREDTQRINHTKVHNKINTVTSSVLPAIRQPPEIATQNPTCRAHEGELLTHQTSCRCQQHVATYQHWKDGLKSASRSPPLISAEDKNCQSQLANQ